MTKSHLKLIVDNTGESKLRSLLTRQKRLIKDKIKAQDQIKAESIDRNLWTRNY